MRFLHSLLLLAAAGAAQAASSWGFDDASVVVGSKKSADRSVIKFSETSPASEPVSFGSSEPLKVLLTAKENGKAKRPHQAFLVLREPASGLEAPFPFTVKDNGKAVVEIKQADLPIQLAISPEPLQASVVLASFGASSAGFQGTVFDIEVARAADDVKPLVYEKPLRYGKLEEIHHVFRTGDKTPPKIVSVVFALAVVVTVPGIVVGWFALDANLAHLSTALGKAPISHIVFFGSVVAMEGVFFLYYVGWNLFQVLPLMGAVGLVSFLSGTRALGEVQSRRLAGER
ncbi:putative oligosaccharyltransferase subunit ribophorin ii protein [Eutypa lata UCREL1]|uniref:Putative oligosaccharyltransferase subunit ribophorin ii protein n=1 Tax=Eutypa lata (strain UCR-EL1) TaxID=1287681 RepID=M7SFE8_EUTLA|nr:putative oligosaccharyltransferase subunit ribophorin ii protein [Eutypa lata UCREL1]